MNRNKIDQIYAAVKKVNLAYELWASKHGLTLYEMLVYYVILNHEDTAITQKNLCTELDAPKTSINSIIKKQLKTGYIEMHINPDNKREKVLSLTDSGRRFAEQLIYPLFQYEEDSVSMLDEHEMEAAIITQNEFADLLLEKVNEASVKEK